MISKRGRRRKLRLGSALWSKIVPSVENVLEGELGLGIGGGGGELDGVDVDVNQLGVTMTLESCDL